MRLYRCTQCWAAFFVANRESIPSPWLHPFDGGNIEPVYADRLALWAGEEPSHDPDH